MDLAQPLDRQTRERQEPSRIGTDQIDFDELSHDTVMEILTRSNNTSINGKRIRSDEKEFPDGSDWKHLSMAQLRRACLERNIPDVGNRQALLAALDSELTGTQ